MRSVPAEAVLRRTGPLRLLKSPSLATNFEPLSDSICAGSYSSFLASKAADYGLGNRPRRQSIAIVCRPACRVTAERIRYCCTMPDKRAFGHPELPKAVNVRKSRIPKKSKVISQTVSRGEKQLSLMMGRWALRCSERHELSYPTSIGPLIHT